MKKVAIGCLGITAICAILFGAFVFWVLRELPVLDATMSAPTTVELDSTMTIDVTMTNPHKEAVVLDSIDIDETFLSGFQIIDVQPKPTETMSFLGTRTWEYARSVAPGKTLEVHFTLKAIQEGHFVGEIYVYNPNLDSTTMFADVVIKKELPKKPDEPEEEDSE
jgi:hypothetical protein